MQHVAIQRTDPATLAIEGPQVPGIRIQLFQALFQRLEQIHYTRCKLTILRIVLMKKVMDIEREGHCLRKMSLLGRSGCMHCQLWMWTVDHIFMSSSIKMRKEMVCTMKLFYFAFLMRKTKQTLPLIINCR